MIDKKYMVSLKIKKIQQSFITMEVDKSLICEQINYSHHPGWYLFTFVCDQFTQNQRNEKIY